MPVVDAAERKKFLDTLRQDDDFRAEVRRELLTEELLNLPQTVAALIDHGAQMQRDLTALVATTRQLLEINQNLAVEMRQGFGTVREDLGSLREDLGSLREDVSSVQEDVGSVQEDVGSLRGDMEARFIAIDARFDQVDAEIRDTKNPPAA